MIIKLRRLGVAASVYYYVNGNIMNTVFKIRM
jgi:hypothetical protein